MRVKTDHEDQKDGARTNGHQGFQNKPEDKGVVINN